MVKCFNCGENNPDENIFCSKCNAQLKVNKNINNIQQPENIQQNPNQQIPNQQIPNQQIPNQQIPNQQIPNQQIPNNQQNQNIGNKKSKLSTTQIILIVVAICCVGILVVAFFGGMTSDKGSLPSNGSSNNSSRVESAFNSLTKENCTEISYKELNKNPDKYYGENIKLRGKVMQISEGGSPVNTLLLQVGGDVSQIAYIEYKNETNIVEDDWITVYGIGGGSYTYDTKVGGSNTVPFMFGKYLEKSS